MARTFILTGGAGNLTVCADSGRVLARGADARGRPVYPAVRSVDVAEWRAFYPGEELAGQTVDILDLATVNRRGRVCPAEADFRAELARIHAEA